MSPCARSKRSFRLMAEERRRRSAGDSAAVVYLEFLKVAIAEAVDQEIAMIDCGEKFLVIGPRTQAANFPAAPRGRLLNACRQLFQAAAVVHAGQGVQ